MSRLNKLIQKLCPDGVEYETIKETVGVNRGKRLTKSQLSDDGKYEVYHGSKDSILGKYYEYNAPANTVIVINTGGIGGVKFLDKPFWCSDGSFWLGQSSRINNKYLYYYLSGYENYFYSQKRVGGVPTIERRVVEDFKIPIPPLNVQKEIVRILDTFTSHAAELQAELQARKEQYEYYRNKLLTFDKDEKNVKWMKLGELCEIYTGGEPPKCTIKGNFKDEEHPYPIWANGKDIYGYSSTYKINKDAVVISSIGANTGTVYYRKAYFTPIIRLKVLVPKDKTILSKYLYYYLSTISIVVKSSSVPNINANEVKKMQVPILPIFVQQRIVSILDKFEALVNDLTEGIPAEVAAVQEQYEYYRNKLLTFKDVGTYHGASST